MAKVNFSNTELVRKGWAATKSNVPLLLKVLLLFVAVYAVNFILDGILSDQLLIFILFSIAGTVVDMLLQIGITKIALDIVDKKSINLKEAFSHFELVIPYFVTTLMFFIIFIIGLILLIIPGIYFTVKYQFYTYVIVDKKLGYWAALKESGSLVKGRWMKIFIFDLALIGLNILGLLALGVGLLLTIPTSFFAAAYLYRRLASSK